VVSSSCVGRVAWTKINSSDGVSAQRCVDPLAALSGMRRTPYDD
jgi:hypothetical protein